MASIETFWEVEGHLIHDCWIRLPLGDGESFRFAPEGAARDVLRYARTAGLTVRLVRVTREVVESG
jgi:hypothetical protein